MEIDTDVSCENSEITATVTGGSGDYQYVWTGPNEFSANTEYAIIADNGQYCVTVIDQNNLCEISHLQS